MRPSDPSRSTPPTRRGARRAAVAAAGVLLAAAAAAIAQDAPPQGQPPAPQGQDQPPAPPPSPPPQPPGPRTAGTPPLSGTPAPATIVAGREGTWPAPTAEDWKKPVLITFQRTWDDALEVAKETGKPLLVCVNMDGEIASEHYAGVRYRDPATAALYEPYVCVIASVYRHTPSDYDAEGRRVLCPRFGSVTCGEHIWIEPVLYEKFFEGQRVAPRHVMVELDGKETYDVFYRNDVQSVIDDIKIAIDKRPAPPPVVRGDRSLADKVASRDIADRKTVEAAYAQGDAAARKSILDAALAQGAAAPLDVLRMAVFGLDPEAAKQARTALAASESPAATDLIVESLRVPMTDAEKEALLAALEKIGKTSPRAQWLAVVQRGLGAQSGTVNEKDWAKAAPADASAQGAADWYELEARRRKGAEARRAEPADPKACLDVAETTLALAVKTQRANGADESKSTRALSRLMFEDARRAALQAEQLGVKGWRVDTVVALSAYYQGNAEEAYARAETAVKDLPPGEGGWNSMAVLSVFAESRWKAIKKAVREKQKWPPQWLADVNSTYSVLRKHPHGSADQVVWHLDFLDWLGARGQVARVISEGVARFTDSPVLHDRLRAHALATRGIEGLETAYDKLLEDAGGSASLHWYAGQAAIVAAEYHRRAWNVERCVAAYDRAIGLYEKAAAADASLRGDADHRIALALASRGRFAFEREDYDRAVADVVASFEKSPTSAASLDGLSFSPAATAQMLLARLKQEKKDELAAKLEKALSKLDPALLVVPKGM